MAVILTTALMVATTIFVVAHIGRQEGYDFFMFSITSAVAAFLDVFAVFLAVVLVIVLCESAGAETTEEVSRQPIAGVSIPDSDSDPVIVKLDGGEEVSLPFRYVSFSFSDAEGEQPVLVEYRYGNPMIGGEMLRWKVRLPLGLEELGGEGS